MVSVISTNVLLIYLKIIISIVIYKMLWIKVVILYLIKRIIKVIGKNSVEDQ